MKRFLGLFFIAEFFFIVSSYGEDQKDVNKELLRAVTVHNGHETIEMLALGADVNARNDLGWTPLMIAADKHSESMVEFFIQVKADVNAKTVLGETALTIAIGNASCNQELDNHLIVKALVDAGADVNVCNHFGVTPLLMASKCGYYHTACVLIDAKADVNKQDDDGFSSLMHAVNKGYLSIVEKLLAKNADVSLKNKEGKDVLMLAAQNGYIPIVQTLITKGADAQVMDNHGNTALAYALQNGHTEIVNILSNAPKLEVKITAEKIFFAIFLWIFSIGLFIWNRRRLIKLEKEPFFGRKLLFNDLVWGFLFGLTFVVTVFLLSKSGEELAHLIGYYIGLWLGLAFARNFFYFFFWWWKPAYLCDRFARNVVRLLFYLYSWLALMYTIKSIQGCCFWAAIFELIMFFLIYNKYRKMMALQKLEEQSVCEPSQLNEI